MAKRPKSDQRREAKQAAVRTQGCYLCGAGCIPNDLTRWWLLDGIVSYNPRSFVLDGDPSLGPVTVICRRCLAKSRRTPDGTFRLNPSAPLLEPPKEKNNGEE